MARTMNLLPAGTQIMEWFEEGNTGSVYKLSMITGYEKQTISAALKQLQRAGMVGVVDRTIQPHSRGRLCPIWGEIEVTFKGKPVNVMAAIDHQSDLVKIFNVMVST